MFAFLLLGHAFAASSWTSYFSEEGTGYKTCSSGYSVRGIQCSGDYCDNIRLYCSNSTFPSLTTSDYYWTDFASEEEGWVECDYGYVVTGVACDGDYCDDIALRCTAVKYSYLNDDYTGGRVSDETSASYATTYYRIDGFTITGDYGDNLYPWYVDYN